MSKIASIRPLYGSIRRTQPEIARTFDAINDTLSSQSGFDENNVTIINGVATPDLSKGHVVIVNLSAAITIIANPISFVPPSFWILLLNQDSSGGRKVLFGSNYVLNAALPGMLIPALNTYSALSFIWRSSGKQILIGLQTGLSLT